MLLTVLSAWTATVVQASTITNLTVRSAKMNRDIPVAVVLPEGYDPAGRDATAPKDVVERRDRNQNIATLRYRGFSGALSSCS